MSAVREQIEARPDAKLRELRWWLESTHELHPPLRLHTVRTIRV
jgi:hypothetical protein